MEGSILPPPSVRLLWCDVAGVRRCRVVGHLAWKSVQERGLGLTEACMAMPAHMDTAVPGSGLKPVGEVRIVPEDTKLVRLQWCPSHSLVNVQMQQPAGSPWGCCPRTALRSVLQWLEEQHGLTLKVGFETEFVMMRRPCEGGGHTCLQLPVPVDSSIYCQSSALDAQAEVLDEMVGALEALGVGVQQWHAESAHGQFEIATAPYPALEAADKLLLTREAIQGVAQRRGLLVSFLPKISGQQAGNGCHCHFSLCKVRDGMSAMLGELHSVDSVPGRPGMSEEASSFLAGVLEHLPALLLFTAPSPNSYLRLAPGCWSGCHRVWGWDNREAPLRATVPPAGLVAMNVEYKPLDATANPHIALAAIVTAGMLGLQYDLALPAPLQVDPGSLTPEQCTAAGIEKLPGSLPQALAAFEVDKALQEALTQGIGEKLLTAFVSVKQFEAHANVGGQAQIADKDKIMFRF